MNNRKEVVEALDTAIQVLNDWTCTYASDFCEDKHVDAAKKRINLYGTIAYIADAVQKCKEAKKLFMKLVTHDRVKLFATGDTTLDGKTATIHGWHTPEYAIIMLDEPIGRDTALVLSIYCLDKI